MGPLVGALVVLGQKIPAEIPLYVAPHRVDVVRAVLGVVVLDEERTPLQAIVVGLEPERASCPPEHYVLYALRLDLP